MPLLADGGFVASSFVLTPIHRPSQAPPSAGAQLTGGAASVASQTVKVDLGSGGQSWDIRYLAQGSGEIPHSARLGAPLLRAFPWVGYTPVRRQRAPCLTCLTAVPLPAAQGPPLCSCTGLRSIRTRGGAWGLWASWRRGATGRFLSCVLVRLLVHLLSDLT